MQRVRLVHWNENEAAEKAATLRSAGFKVEWGGLDGAALLRNMRDHPPDAALIDLSRLPSHGRDVALAMRETRATHSIPIVFVGGAPEKVERIRQLLPDAHYTLWNDVPDALRRAMENPPAAPAKRTSRMSAYTSTPLWKKLDMKEDSTNVLINAPEDFVRLLDPLPPDSVLCCATVDRDRSMKLQEWRASSSPFTALFFARSLSDLNRHLADLAPSGSQVLWIAWPKRTSKVISDLNENIVRACGLALGLVDSKVCSIDATWSALKFTRRKTSRGGKER